MNRDLLLGSVMIIMAVPFLQGAGCTAHYTAHVKGSVVHSHPEHAGKTVRVIYSRLDDDSGCSTNWDECLAKTEQWYPLVGCIEERDAPPAAAAVEAGQAFEIDHCTGMVGTRYRSYIVGFIDVDGDGVPSPGDPYGSFGPLTRDLEKTALPLRIELDRVVR